AQLLLLQGDSDSADVRRSKAVGILANPLRALALLEWGARQATAASAGSDPDEDDGPDADGSASDGAGNGAGNGAGGEGRDDPDGRNGENSSNDAGAEDNLDDDGNPAGTGDAAA